MTDERYRPSKLDDALTRIAEECSEVIKIVCKAQRFGLNDHHPKKGQKNIDLLLEELADVETARADFLRILTESQPTEERKDYDRALAEQAGELHTQWSMQYKRACIVAYPNNTAEQIITHARKMGATYDEGDGVELFCVVLRHDVGPELWSEFSLRASMQGKNDGRE